MDFRPGGKRYELSQFLTQNENVQIAELHRTFIAANWVVLFTSSILSIACIAVLTCFAHPLIMQARNLWNIFLISFESLLILLLLMLMEKRRAQEAMRTLMIRAAFKARQTEVNGT